MQIRQIANLRIDVTVKSWVQPSTTREYRAQDGGFWQTIAVEQCREDTVVLSNPPAPEVDEWTLSNPPQVGPVPQWIVTLRRSGSGRGWSRLAKPPSLPVYGEELLPRFTNEEIRAARDAVRVLHPELIRVGVYSVDSAGYDDGLLLVVPTREVGCRMPAVVNEIPTRVQVEG